MPNSKNANVATGEQGLANVREIVQLVARELQIDPTDVLPSSTGVVGWQLPMEKMRAGMLSIDTDTSTSDTVAIMANGLAGDGPPDDFRQALQSMAIELAQELARGGEGATKLLEVTVKDATTFAQAKRVAKAIVNSPLAKTAIFGADPNWGRVAMAIGKCDEQQDIAPEKVSIAFGDLVVYQGWELPQDHLPALKAYLQQPEVTIRVSLGLGEQTATVWGCDLTYGYVKINGEYTT